MGEGDVRTISDLLIDQIEFCNVLVINKCDLLPEEQLDQLECILRKLQPEARLIRSMNGVINPTDILNTNLFDFDLASQSPGWLKELEVVEHVPETEEYGIQSFVYRSRIPFHTERLNQWIEEMPEEIIRAKGLIWCATRNDLALLLSQAGPSVQLEPVAYWVAALPKEQQDVYLRDNQELMEQWDAIYGDRKTELVLIGIEMEKERIIQSLNQCLLTKEEMEGDWSLLQDPFEWLSN